MKPRMLSTPTITIKDALRKCGHKEIYSARTGGTENTVTAWALKENCTACKIKENELRKEREDIAIAKARAIMEARGFFDASYSAINEGAIVEVNLYINVKDA